MIRAFIVDDEEPARERLRRMLIGTGLEIVGEASDGGAALPQIAALAPDLVFLDIQMPGLSGLDVAARLQPPRPRIVFCTAFDEFAIDAFEHHAVDYLLKPVNTDRLARSVTRICGEIEEQRRLAHEETEAVRTQSRLMPSAPRPFAGLDYAGTSRPAHGIGGDYYDFLPLSPTRVGLALGDVSGKGTYAGLLVAALQARMQALVARGTMEPAALLRELNALTIGTMEGNRFATVFYAVYDAGTRTITYASAGHPAAVIGSTDGDVRELEATGPAIGWVGNASFEERMLPVRTGDILAIFSDGLTETIGQDGEPLDTSGVAELVRAASGRSAPDVVAHVMAELERYDADAPAADDRTIVIARIG
jgi:sigma-B regulation protein RsbU (phosphoserine phosphatase)